MTMPLAISSTERVAEEVRAVLGKHLGSIHADTVLESACRRLGCRPAGLTYQHRGRLAEALERPLSLFLDAQVVRAIQGAVRGVESSARPPARLSAERIEIDSEAQVIHARSRARAMALELRFDPVDAVKVATVVSELARNCLQYAGSGTIVLEPEENGLRISATDRGPGIEHLDAVLAGTFRSRTGLGLGLAGSKRLLDEFSVDTGPRGTRVVGRKLR